MKSGNLFCMLESANSLTVQSFVVKFENLDTKLHFSTVLQY